MVMTSLSTDVTSLVAF